MTKRQKYEHLYWLVRFWRSRAKEAEKDKEECLRTMNRSRAFVYKSCALALNNWLKKH